MEEFTDSDWKIMGDKILNLRGMLTTHKSDFIAEPDSKKKSYIKFMSDHGITDAWNGSVLIQYMIGRGYKVDFDPLYARTMSIRNKDLRKEFL